MTRDIWKERHILEKEKMDLKEKLFEPYKEGFRVRYAELVKACGESEKGHNFRYSHLGPLNNAWFYCSSCGKSKVEGYDE